MREKRKIDKGDKLNMHKLTIKPLSTNKAYCTPRKVKRYASKEYKRFKRNLMLILPKIEVPEGNLEIWIYIGVSNSGFDMFNAEKCFTDILQKKYGFNDNKIFMGHMKKEVVKKGEEYIAFEIKNIEVNNER